MNGAACNASATDRPSVFAPGTSRTIGVSCRFDSVEGKLLQHPSEVVRHAEQPAREHLDLARLAVRRRPLPAVARALLGPDRATRP